MKENHSKLSGINWTGDFGEYQDQFEHSERPYERSFGDSYGFWQLNGQELWISNYVQFLFERPSDPDGDDIVIEVPICEVYGVGIIPDINTLKLKLPDLDLTLLEEKTNFIFVKSTATAKQDEFVFCHSRTNKLVKLLIWPDNPEETWKNFFNYKLNFLGQACLEYENK